MAHTVGADDGFYIFYQGLLLGSGGCGQEEYGEEEAGHECWGILLLMFFGVVFQWAMSFSSVVYLGYQF